MGSAQACNTYCCVAKGDGQRQPESKLVTVTDIKESSSVLVQPGSFFELPTVVYQADLDQLIEQFKPDDASSELEEGGMCAANSEIFLVPTSSRSSLELDGSGGQAAERAREKGCGDTRPSRIVWNTAQRDSEIASVAGSIDMCSTQDPQAATDEEVCSKLRKFQKEREEEAARAFQAVVTIGVIFYCVGKAIYILASILERITDSRELVASLKLIGGFFVALGLVWASTCPLERMNLDTLSLEWSIIRITLFGTLAVYSTYHALIYPPHVHILPSITAFLGSFRWQSRCAYLVVPRSTIVITTSFLFSMLSWAAYYINEYLHQSPGDCSDTCALILGFFWFLGVLATPGAGIGVFRWQQQSVGTDAAWTYAAYLTLYFWWFCNGIDFSIRGVYVCVVEPTVGTLTILSGLSYFSPVMLVVSVGRKRLFGFTARRLDRKLGRSQRDGAFIAALLDAAVVARGMNWWEHRPEGEKNALYHVSDQRHHWRRGKVVRKYENVIDVVFDAEEFLSASARAAAGATESLPPTVSNASSYPYPEPNTPSICTGHSSGVLSVACDPTPVSGNSSATLTSKESTDSMPAVVFNASTHSANSNKQWFSSARWSLSDTCSKAHSPQVSINSAREKKYRSSSSLDDGCLSKGAGNIDWRSSQMSALSSLKRMHVGMSVLSGQKIKALLKSRSGGGRLGWIGSRPPTNWLPSVTKTITMHETDGTSEAIVENARNNLRCMDWQEMTWELISSGAICCGSELALQQNEYYALSRSVKPGEKIDFFISHSWNDDPEAKWSALQNLVAEFVSRIKRPPTFWFDKTCIDQQNIANGLRILPVCVMSCNKVLVLHGVTYSSRLWCIWELFVLLAFTNELEQFAEKLHVVALNPEERIQESFASFDVRNARCYDPNDERRLRQVIDALGLDEFNGRVRQLEAVNFSTQLFPKESKTNFSERLMSRSTLLGRSLRSTLSRAASSRSSRSSRPNSSRAPSSSSSRGPSSLSRPSDFGDIDENELEDET